MGGDEIDNASGKPRRGRKPQHLNPLLSRLRRAYEDCLVNIIFGKLTEQLAEILHGHSEVGCATTAGQHTVCVHVIFENRLPDSLPNMGEEKIHD